jgi:hypothetical protein
MSREAPVSLDRCSVSGCNRWVATKGYCNMHYLRVRQYGDPGEAETRLVGRKGVCLVAGCAQPIRARGLCRTHYEVAMLGKVACAVEGCQRPRATKRDGLCSMHYSRLRRNGEVGPPHSLLGTSTGYKRVWFTGASECQDEGATDDGQVSPEPRGALEHRLVMERMLGRALHPGETVHPSERAAAGQRSGKPRVVDRRTPARSAGGRPAGLGCRDL